MQSFESVFEHMIHIGWSSMFAHDAINQILYILNYTCVFFLLFAGKNSFFLVVELEVSVSGIPMLLAEVEVSDFLFPFNHF